MKNHITLLLCLLLSLQVAEAQNESPQEYQNFPIIITLQFHSLSIPFKNMKSNFKNFGIGIGTEVSYGNSPRGVQQFNLLWYRNKAVGNGILLSTQAVWRPDFDTQVFGELKTGIGYLMSFRPSRSFTQNNGVWTFVGRKGKGMFVIPTGISLGYYPDNEDFTISPFASYQLLLLKDYNTTIPLVPETLFQVGTIIH